MNTLETEVKRFTIPVCREAKLKAEVDRLKRVCAKLGVLPAPTLRMVPDSEREVPQLRKQVILEEGTPQAEKNMTVVVEVADFELTLPAAGIRVAGDWRVIAMLETTKAPGGLQNEISASKGNTLKAERYRERASCCDHCGVDRQRGFTLLLERPDQELRQVGGECSKLYVGDVGDDAVRAMRFQKELVQFVELVESDTEKLYAGADYLMAWDAKEVIAHALACSREHGWVPVEDRQTFRPNADATVHTVRLVLERPGLLGLEVPPYRICEADREKAGEGVRGI